MPHAGRRAARPKDERLGWPEDRALRGVFVTGSYAAQKWTEILDKLAARGMNAVVLDAKDYTGPVNYPTKAKIAVEIGAAEKAQIPDLARAIRFAHRRGIRVILRIPCFHDPMADKKAKDGRLSLKMSQLDRPLHIDWLDPTNPEANHVRGMLRERRCADEEVLRELFECADHRRGNDQPAEPPARHIEVLREAVDGHDVVAER